MAPHVPPDVRELIPVWRHEQHLTIEEISTRARCSIRTVQTILAYDRDYGVVSNPFAFTRGQDRVLNTGDLNFISSLLSAIPTLFLDELQSQLLLTRGVDVSISTLSRAVHSLAITHKQVSKEAIERDNLLRSTWQGVHGSHPADYYVWIDESSVDDHTNQRTNGWAAMGRPCIRRATFIRGQRYSVLPALCSDGIIALDIFEGSVNKDKFIRFLKEDLVCCTDTHLMYNN